MQRDQDIVFGFIKRSQSLLPYQQNPYYTIPASIGYIILPYYSAPEYFTAHGNKMLLNKERNICKFVGGINANTVYGAFKIHNKAAYNKLVWYFLVNVPQSQTIAAIGISSGDKTNINTTFVCSGSNVIYAWQCYLQRATIYYINDGYLDSKSYGEKFTFQDTKVGMEIDIKNKTLKYYLNGKDQGVALNDIDFEEKEYYLAITLDEKADVKLLDFYVL